MNTNATVMTFRTQPEDRHIVRRIRKELADKRYLSLDPENDTTAIRVALRGWNALAKLAPVAARYDMRPDELADSIAGGEVATVRLAGTERAEVIRELHRLAQEESGNDVLLTIAGELEAAEGRALVNALDDVDALLAFGNTLDRAMGKALADALEGSSSYALEALAGKLEFVAGRALTDALKFASGLTLADALEGSGSDALEAFADALEATVGLALTGALERANRYALEAFTGALKGVGSDALLAFAGTLKSAAEQEVAHEA